MTEQKLLSGKIYKFTNNDGTKVVVSHRMFDGEKVLATGFQIEVDGAVKDTLRAYHQLLNRFNSLKRHLKLERR